MYILCTTDKILKFLSVVMVTFVSFISKDNIENTGWNKNLFNKLHNIADNTNNRFIEYKN